MLAQQQHADTHEKKNAPQIAVSRIKSASQGFGLACFAEVGKFKAWFPVVRLPVSAAQFYDQGRQHSL